MQNNKLKNETPTDANNMLVAGVLICLNYGT